MWKTFEEDGANKSLELGELISRNIQTRMTPFGFSDEILGKRGKKMDKIELRNVLEGEKFITGEHLHENDLSPGDLLKVSSRYFVNIRAACDLFPDRSADKPNYDDVQLYLVGGSKLSEAKVKKALISNMALFRK